MRSKQNPGRQLLLPNQISLRRPPSTRYQGSKYKLLDWIWSVLRKFEFESVLDAFGGTGCVSYLLKSRGKSVVYNDYLKFNHLIGTAIIENRGFKLASEQVSWILTRDSNHNYDNLIAETFAGIYFTNEENSWIDFVSQNIARIPDKYGQAIAYYALFQSCIAKRPYNLFHRKNLYMRLAEVPRSFGNKRTWDTPFEDHFKAFVAEVNNCVFDSGSDCAAHCYDAIDVPGKFDLVYLDPPYVNDRGSTIDYRDFYHFLEGIVGYQNWRAEIDHSRKHLPLVGSLSPWSDPNQVRRLFSDCFGRYTDSIIALSYGNKGIPSVEEIISLLRKQRQHVEVFEQPNYKYVLSTDRETKEMLFVAW